MEDVPVSLLIKELVSAGIKTPCEELFLSRHCEACSKSNPESDCWRYWATEKAIFTH